MDPGCPWRSRGRKPFIWPILHENEEFLVKCGRACPWVPFGSTNDKDEQIPLKFYSNIPLFLLLFVTYENPRSEHKNREREVAMYHGKIRTLPYSRQRKWDEALSLSQILGVSASVEPLIAPVLDFVCPSSWVSNPGWISRLHSFLHC